MHDHRLLAVGFLEDRHRALSIHELDERALLLNNRLNAITVHTVWRIETRG